MIIVTGLVRARPDSLDQVVELSLEHVRRSRVEPGCTLHSVHHDLEDPLTIVFLEHWEDREALAAHFEVPASRSFATAMARLATEPPAMNIYDAEPINRGPGRI